MKPEKMADESNKPRIIIIGAGISGITAGNHLIKSGYDNFVILEASSRTGGRIWSVDLGNRKCFNFLHL